MFLIIFLFLFIGGSILGVAAWSFEETNRKFKKIIPNTIKLMLILSLLIIIIGILLAHANAFMLGMYLFIPTLTIFLVRQTFIFFKVQK